MAQIKGRHPQLLQAVMDINADQRRAIVRKLERALGSVRGQTIGLLGLAFKPNTDDMREAPSTHIARMLFAAGARVRGYDPVAMEVAARHMPELELAPDPYTLAEGCDAVVIVTEWNEFKHLDLTRLGKSMNRPVIVDGRSIYDPAAMKALGFHYQAIGRGQA
jgi:UDPglucose 6-dehydrogenase